MQLRLAVYRLALVCCLSLLSCQHSELRYLDREVASEELIGTWSMSPETIRTLRELGYRLPLDASALEIVLRGDGGCSFRGVIRPFDAWGRDTPVADVECAWQLGTLTGYQALLFVSDSPEPISWHYFFDETNDGRLMLWQHASDPDAWRYVEYVKE